MMAAHWKYLLYTALCIHLNVTATSAIPQSTDINPLELKQYAQLYSILCSPHGKISKHLKFFGACAAGFELTQNQAQLIFSTIMAEVEKRLAECQGSTTLPHQIVTIHETT